MDCWKNKISSYQKIHSLQKSDPWIAFLLDNFISLIKKQNYINS
jgi:hypothetical protein